MSEAERLMARVESLMTRLEAVLGPPAPEGDPSAMRGEALRWALAHGSRSGRSAFQFARDRVGQERLRRQGPE